MADRRQETPFVIIYEYGPTSVSAYVPALPGCVATSPNYTETARRIHEAIQMHLEGMAEDGDTPPLAADAQAPRTPKPGSLG